jgi:hypothetical protein
MSFITNKQNNETNTRIYTRNIPTQELQPYLDIKPMSTTRCSVFPILDQRQPNVHSYPTYNVGAVFNPGNRMAPWSGFSNKIGDESILRNQIYPLEKSNSNNVYVPSSKSDLYVPIINADESRQQMFPLLSETYLPPAAVAPKPNDPLIFGNHTRYQL